jgi:phage-related holin
LISITENAGKLGVPLPGVLVRFLARLRDHMD